MNKLASTGFALFVAACGPKPVSTTVPPDNTQTIPPNATTQSSVLAADGKHFAAERVYEGNCAPAGSRGGCYTLTLRPDGTMGYFMLDAGLEGSYVIEGSEVVITPSGGAEPQRFALSADYAQAGELALKP